MKRPQKLWEQYQGKLLAELNRGTGNWPVQPHACALEPPWCEFDDRSVTVWDCYVNDWEGPYLGASWTDRLFASREPLLTEDCAIVLAEVQSWQQNELTRIVIEKFPEDESTIPLAQEFVRALPNLRNPVSFEIAGKGPTRQYDMEKLKEPYREEKSILEHMEDCTIGWNPGRTSIRFVTHKADAGRVESLLLANYPNSAVRVETFERHEDDVIGIASDVCDGSATGGTAQLENLYCWPLRVFTRIDPDPLGVALAAMDQLGRSETALIQILFAPTTEPWAMSAQQSICDPYTPGGFIFTDVTDRQLKEKFSSPLFAVSIRVFSTCKATVRQLEGWVSQFSTHSQSMSLACLDGEEELLYEAMPKRCTFRPGLLLNVEELASLVHLPGKSVHSETLQVVNRRTQQAPESKEHPEAIILGDNEHRGKVRHVRLMPELRYRHTYVAGASGTGKSTLLLNMILQDIMAGSGVGVLDPHGDLITKIIRNIPSYRHDDVVLFDPADREYPFALNVLEADNRDEHERIVAETVIALKRQFQDSWGQRLERILTFSLYTLLDALPGATMAEVERILTDEGFREYVLSKAKTQRFVRYWQNEFPKLRGDAIDPVLNKLSEFLLNRTVRNIICQRKSSVRFDDVLDDGKIFLANLSTGALNERNSATFGSIIVTRIMNAAFRRARIPEDQRRPFFLYIDEFQAFMNTSIGFDRILAEARKYKLVLAGIANQYVGQIAQEVRQAIFGNIGSMVVFRLGVADARLIQNEMGNFTAEEILSLERGEAIGRAGSSSNAFNLKTYPPPPEQEPDPTEEIVQLSRANYCRHRDVVEKELEADVHSEENSDEPGFDGIADPNEDDFVR